MNSLYTTGVRQTASIQADLDKMRNGDSSAALQGQIAASLAALHRTADNMAAMARREPTPAKQEKSLMRLQKFQADYHEYKAQFDHIKTEHKNSQNTAQRSELFLSVTGTAMSATDARRRVSAQPEPPNTSESPFNAPGGSSSRDSHALREHSFIQDTGSRLDDFVTQGREVLDNLIDQRKILTGTHNRVLDAATTIGLGRDVIGWIEKRSRQDTIIFFLGLIFTIFCFYWIWRWFG